MLSLPGLAPTSSSAARPSGPRWSASAATTGWRCWTTPGSRSRSGTRWTRARPPTSTWPARPRTNRTRRWTAWTRGNCLSDRRVELVNVFVCRSQILGLAPRSGHRFSFREFLVVFNQSYLTFPMALRCGYWQTVWTINSEPPGILWWGLCK